ncbi:penicillin-binding transpeptidase domain-containing protein [Streptomyces sp. NRRL F-5126]|uniref:penicillin-binding transpeptidase domain-containing protein n=1 Tax=Streptomyces sp. NRRL F-5126 TaxID=1463857 RepID=UPI0004C60FF5|nr:penicillin-binding transpeptidase domain-containing protein [Streptomyces sp. NRRL F-5126]
MTRQIRHTAAFCLLLLVALLANAVRLQGVEAENLDKHPGNPRPTVQRFGRPRGSILVDGSPVTGSRDTHQRLRYERTYTQGPLYAPVTGYVSQTYGSTGIENAEDGILGGSDPRLAPLSFSGDHAHGRSAGGTVVTTIEKSLQRAAYTGLDGRRGAVVAIEPASGRILALVSSPSYDPGVLSGTGSRVTDAWSRLNHTDTQPMLNRALNQSYPPGSAFKIVTAAAALESGVVKDVDAPTGIPAPYPLPGTSTSLPNEADGCGNASLKYAITWSCNTVMAGLGVKVGLAKMVGTTEKFGFNDPSLRIPSPVSASRFDEHMSPDQLALSSIGQYDTTATPLQMAMVSAAVANDGVLRYPRLVDHTETASGRLVSRDPDRTYKRVMSATTARKLRRMMVNVVRTGTGGNGAIKGATVGGKTGTAQHGVGNAGLPYAWFIAWAQAKDAASPAVAVAVVVEDAEADRADISGGGVAAPIAKSVMKAALARDRAGRG